MHCQIEYRPATMVWNGIEQSRDSLAALCRRHSGHRLSLFGSATGTAFDPECGDLDFVVEFDEPDAAGLRRSLLRPVGGLQKAFGRSVDLLTPPALESPYLRNTMEQSGVDLYAA